MATVVYVLGGNCIITTKASTHIFKLFVWRFYLIMILRECMIWKLRYKSILI